MRSQIEAQLELIATGKANFEEVLAHAVATFMAKYKYFVDNTEYMDQVTFPQINLLYKKSYHNPD